MNGRVNTGEQNGMRVIVPKKTKTRSPSALGPLGQLDYSQ